MTASTGFQSDPPLSILDQCFKNPPPPQKKKNEQNVKKVTVVSMLTMLPQPVLYDKTTPGFQSGPLAAQLAAQLMLH